MNNESRCNISIKISDLRRLLQNPQANEIQLKMKTKKLQDDNFEVSLSSMVLTKTQLKELGLQEPQPRKKETEVKDTSKAPKWFQDFVEGPFKGIQKDVSSLKQNYSKLAVEVGEINDRLEKVEQVVATIQSLDSIKREMNAKKRSDEYELKKK